MPQPVADAYAGPSRGVGAGFASRPSSGSKSTPSRMGRSMAAVRSAQARTNYTAARAASIRDFPCTSAPVRTLETT